MKKIIDGRIYNTDTATEICSWDNGLSRSDFRWMEEKLYITKRGNFFLAGEGGAMTKYGCEYPDGTCSGGEGIFPISPEEAREWAEQYGEIEDIEKFFPVEEA